MVGQILNLEFKLLPEQSLMSTCQGRLLFFPFSALTREITLKNSKAGRSTSRNIRESEESIAVIIIFQVSRLQISFLFRRIRVYFYIFICRIFAIKNVRSSINPRHAKCDAQITGLPHIPVVYLVSKTDNHKQR